jgi:SpoVK/Ycf46/Vps4 family AAA+-type ATPase
VDLPAADARRAIFLLHLEQRGRLGTDFDLERLAAASEGFSGAEIEGVVVAALYHAFSDRQNLSTQILLDEIAATRPLSRLRPHKVEALQEWGRHHAVPA